MIDRGPFLTPAGLLLNADRAVINPRKLTGYSLDPDHPRGGDKAVTFDQVLGFNRSNADDLIAAIREGILFTPARYRGADAHGHRFTVDLLLTGPTGRLAPVRTNRIYHPGELIPSLTAAFVRRRRSDARASAP